MLTVTEQNKIENKIQEAMPSIFVQVHSELEVSLDGWFTLAELKWIVETIEKKGE